VLFAGTGDDSVLQVGKTKQTAPAALADFLESSRTRMLALLRRSARFFDSQNAPGLVEPWFRDQIDYLRGGPSHACEWTSLLVDMVRARGGGTAAVLAAVRAVRDVVVDCCLGRVEGASDADLLRVILDIEDEVLRHLGDLCDEAERSLLAGEQRRQKALAESMAQGFATLTADGAISLANSHLANLVGVTEERLTGQDFLALCDTSTAGEIKMDLRPSRGTSARAFEGTLVTARGARIPASFRVLPVFGEEGRRFGLAVAVSAPEDADRADGHSTQARRLADTADALGLGFYTVDHIGLVAVANEHARSVAVVGEEDPLRAQMQAATGRAGAPEGGLSARTFETGATQRGRVQLCGRMGDTRWVEIATLALRGPRGAIDHVAVFVRDVTALKRLEDELLRQQRSSLVSQLAVSVAHQLRSPIGVMIGFAEMLNQGLPSDQVPVAVDRLVRNGIRCKEIIDHLLDFGRGAPGRARTPDLAALVREHVRSAYADSLGQRITWELDEAGVPVACAPEQLTAVLIHLLDNALWAADARVAFAVSASEDTVRVEVWNDGPGVPPEHRERLFEPFFTTREKEGATGLGLSLSRAVTEEYGGRLFLDESAAHGARFVVELPMGADAETDTAEPEVPARPIGSGRRLLVVEDDEDQVFLLDLALRSAGHEVDSAPTGARAVELINTRDYDGLVIDMLLGDELGGRDLYDVLLRANPDLAGRSLFVTADTMKYETRRFLESVKRPYLEKPFLIADFTAEVERLLETPSSAAPAP